jgi:uncharacterized protein YjbI with pentapeptide repeats
VGLLRSPSRQLDRAVYDAHQKWLKAGGKGPGRLVAEDESLLGIVATAMRLNGAQFKRCVMSSGDLNNTHFKSVLLLACDLSKTNLYMAMFASATMKDCVLAEARLSLAMIVESRVTGCDLTEADAARLLVKESSVEHTDFKGAMLLDAQFEASRFFDCSFHGANLGRKSGGPALGTTRTTHFENCDFRGADFAGRKLRESKFINCHFHEAVGVPELGDGVVVEGADLSAEADGSDIVEPSTFLERWKNGALSALY